MNPKLCIVALFVVLIGCAKVHEEFYYMGKVVSYNPTVLEQVSDLSSDTYYLYVPSSYTKDQMRPLVMCFSPSADGKTPVDSLRFAAETFNYIVVGLNNVRNNHAGNFLAVQNVLKDVKRKYSIDANRIYGCGFSGGGRLATALAEQGMLDGVISCSAGPANAQFINPVPWYGIAGEGDFNYTEMVDYKPSARMKKSYYLAYHNKGHEWPDSASLYNALAFMEMKSYQKSTSTWNNALLNAYQDYEIAKMKALAAQGRGMEAIHLAEQDLNTLDDYLDVGLYQYQLKAISEKPGYKLELVRANELKELDKKLRQTYTTAFVQMDKNWWKAETSKLDKRIESATGETKYTLMRIRGYIGIVGYMYSKRFIDLNHPDTQRVLDNYATVEPNNPDVYYFKALYAHKLEDAKSSEKYINMALDLGLSDAENKMLAFK